MHKHRGKDHLAMYWLLPLAFGTFQKQRVVNQNEHDILLLVSLAP